MGSCQDFKEVVKSRPHTDSAVRGGKNVFGTQNSNGDDNDNDGYSFEIITDDESNNLIDIMIKSRPHTDSAEGESKAKMCGK